MRTRIYPMRHFSFRPSFWGVERDLKDVLDSMETAWESGGTTNTNLKETELAYLLALDLPGVNKSNLELNIENDLITVSALRRNPFAKDEESDKDQQKIVRTLSIPKMVDREKIQAHLEDGVLYLVMPKAEKARPRKIEIVDGSNKSNLTKMISS